MTDQLSADERDDPAADEPTPALGIPRIGEHTSEARHEPDVAIDPATPSIAVPGERDRPSEHVDVEPAALTAAPSAQRRWFRRRRVSKWDRPPDPHDWRFFVGTLGKILIATGMLLFGFVAYQLWGTGIETARAQNTLENEFEAALAEAEVEVAPVEPIDPVEPATEGVPADAADGVSDETAVDVADEVTAEPGADAAAPDEPPSDAGPSEPAPPADPADPAGGAIEQDVPAVVRGDAIARLDMPTIDKSLFVVPGVNVDDLKDGPGHYPDTPLPGQLGNSAIAGHRTTYGEPFIDLDDLNGGDEIIVTTLYGTFVYEVTGARVVSPDDTHVVQTDDWDTATLTLTTCHPKYTARERLIVNAVLNPAKSSDVGVPTFYSLDDEAEEFAGDDPTIETTLPGEPAPALDANGTADVEPATGSARAPVDADTIVDPEPTASDEAAEDDSEPEVAAPPVAVSEPPAAAIAADEQPAPQDAFSRGWFDDEEAFPQIALWGFALAAIALLAYAVSRRVRHDSVGFVLGIAPFMVALYFFFQNVHRLLPPGI